MRSWNCASHINRKGHEGMHKAHKEQSHSPGKILCALRAWLVRCDRLCVHCG